MSILFEGCQKPVTLRKSSGSMRHVLTSRISWGMAVVVAGVVGLTGVASAIVFNVNPVQVRLSAHTRSATLTLKNESAEASRFQVSVFAWDQKPNGEMALTPTEDILAFPALLTLGPTTERMLRVGMAVPPAEQERTYRVFIEEMPPEETPHQEKAHEIRFITRLGIPIFIAPPRPVIQGQIDNYQIVNGTFTFRVRNTGNVHFTAKTTSVVGTGSGGETVFSRQTNGWYILAGGTREYTLEIPRSDCLKTNTITVTVKADETSLQGEFRPLPGSCGAE
jgi:fimbrial chaperone protein